MKRYTIAAQVVNETTDNNVFSPTTKVLNEFAQKNNFILYLWNRPGEYRLHKFVEDPDDKEDQLLIEHYFYF